MSRDAVDTSETELAADASPSRDSLLDSLEQQARTALAKSPLMALRQLSVDRSDNRLLISGHVSTFYQKQQAQELVRANAPGLAVVNDIQVT